MNTTRVFMPTFALGALWRPEGRRTKARPTFRVAGWRPDEDARGKAQYPHFTVPSNTQQVKRLFASIANAQPSIHAANRILNLFAAFV